MNKLSVIGIGYKPLDPKARETVLAADDILASRRLYEVFTGYDEFPAVQDKIRMINNVDETIAFIRSRLGRARLVLLASGDPLFFGIGRRAVKEFGKEAVEVVPELSSIQLAFARIGEAWDDALLMSLHGGPDPVKRRRLPYTINDLPALLRRHDKIAILTDRENNPAAIAAGLSAFSGLRIYVGEKLGYPDERMVEGAPEEIARKTFADPNVVVLIKPPEEKREALPVFGLSEEDISHSRGLITKDEVRAVSLHKLQLPEEGVLWDIGAGSGSVSVEAARLSPRLRIFAVEKNPEQIPNIRANLTRFAVPTVQLIEGAAPAALRDLLPPDRVFIGGSGGALDETVQHIAGRMAAGVIVVNAATLETLQQARCALQAAGFAVDVTQVSVARLKEIGTGNSFAALNPIFVVRGRKDAPQNPL